MMRPIGVGSKQIEILSMKYHHRKKLPIIIFLINSSYTSYDDKAILCLKDNIFYFKVEIKKIKMKVSDFFLTFLIKIIRLSHV